MRRLAASVFLLLLVAGSAAAATFDDVSDKTLITRAELVVTARVMSVSTTLKNKDIFTDYVLNIDGVVKGDAPHSTITVSEWGGTFGDQILFVDGAAKYEVGSRVLAFLGKRDDGTYFTTAMALGAFRFDDDGRELARNVDGVEVLGSGRPYQRMPTAEFLNYVDTLAHGGNATAPSEIQTRRVEANFTPVTNATADSYAIIDGPAGAQKPIRWNCPSTCTINYKLNGTQPGTNNSDPTAAMAAWNNDPNSSMNMVFAGMTSNDMLTQDGENSILLGNTTSPPIGTCDGTLACGGMRATTTINNWDGVDFYTAFEGDLVFRNTSMGQATFDAILAHELGHTVGIRHSNEAGRTPDTNDALMNSIVPQAGANLHQWDKDAIDELYGPGAICSPPNITSTSGGGTVPYGNTAHLTVSATGTTPFTYEWDELVNDAWVVVGHASSYNTVAITTQHTYIVKISNGCGNAGSNFIVVSPAACTPAAIATQPVGGHVDVGGTYTLTVAASGTSPIKYQWYQSATPGDTSMPVGTNSSSFTTPPLSTATAYWVLVSNACNSQGVASDAVYVTVGSQCVPPMFTMQPVDSTVTIGENVMLTATVTGGEPLTYQWYDVTGGVAVAIDGATTTTLELPPFTTTGTHQYYLAASNGCGTPVNSVTVTVSVTCRTVNQPEITAPGISSPGVGYDVTWTGDASDSYVLEEALDAAFTAGVHTFSGIGTSRHIDAHTEITTPTRIYYRVTTTSSCNQQTSPVSKTTSTVIAPKPAANSSQFNVVVPVGTNTPQSQDYLVPGFGENATPGDHFAISIDVPWLTVFPTAGALSAGGTTVQFSFNPALLGVGTTTATVSITRTQGSSKGSPVANGSAPAFTFPFSASLVTPVTPDPRSTTPPPGTLLIPAVAHADGVGTFFQSDIRIANVSDESITYDLTYTPTQTDGTTTGKKTTITIDAQSTIGLDDVVRSWYGSGVAGEFGLGTLEVRPMHTASGAAPDPNATFASSRTYAISSAGTLGQFIPALPLTSFIGPIAESSLNRMSLQQISQSSQFRTNFGFVEGAGQSVTALARLVDQNNNVLREVPVNLAAYAHMQTDFDHLFNPAGTQAVSLQDGRVEVEVTSSTGKVTAYASVVDNRSSDPLLVTGVQPSTVQASHYVVPGVGDINQFHSDVRIFNASANPVTATMSLNPIVGSAPAPVQINLAPFEVKVLDNTVPSTWGITGNFGALVLDTPNPSSLIATARNFSRDDAHPEKGTLGQFIPGVSSSGGVGAGERDLQILQLEQSASYRTNVGLVEVTGNPVTIEIEGYTGNKVTATTQATLSGNQYTQIGKIFNAMGFDNVYNGRISVKVIGGTGRVAAYGSVVDERTQDPTYVPAQ